MHTFDQVALLLWKCKSLQHGVRTSRNNPTHVYRKLPPTLLSTPVGAAFVNLSADMKIGSEIIGSNSSLSSQSEGVCAVGTPEPSSSTTTESTAGHSNKHVGYRWIHKHLRHPPLHTNTPSHTHTPQCRPLLVTQPDRHTKSKSPTTNTKNSITAASSNFDTSHTHFSKSTF